MSSEELHLDLDELSDDAVNDDEFELTKPRKSDPKARRRLESLLEERRLQRDITDEWLLDDDDDIDEDVEEE
ncbi:PA3496 family putative envelope integrity protein [Larsenimonas salina]|uniref:PA3496 family putative envelope integrity protein n=1 Tax=Larsenimonas salina TaxID=1295565 RepID=UPI00207336F3|nr:hypothetical protein [Larsenimonas salina]MCM5704949.1 hypothetical protein [Larsenimonas salina]